MHVFLCARVHAFPYAFPCACMRSCACMRMRASGLGSPQLSDERFQAAVVRVQRKIRWWLYRRHKAAQVLQVCASVRRSVDRAIGKEGRKIEEIERIARARTHTHAQARTHARASAFSLPFHFTSLHYIPRATAEMPVGSPLGWETLAYSPNLQLA